MKQKVLVVGSTNQDIVIEVDRMPNVGETLFGSALHYFQGGKGANQAIAAHKMGADTKFVSMIGDDAFGRSLRAELDSLNLNADLYVTEESPTGAAIINVDRDGNNVIVVVSGANGKLSLDDVAISLKGVSQGDVLLIQNELNETMLGALLKYGKALGMLTVLNAAPPVYVKELIGYVDYLIVNEHELEVSLGITIESPDDKEKVLDGITSITQGISTNIVVTLGKHGVVASDGDKGYQLDAHTVEVVDTTGAGDCFCGCFAAMLASGSELSKILEVANYAASKSVQQLGASTSYPSMYDVEDLL